MKSTLTRKFQTTVPKEIRERLGLGPSDILQWEVVDGEAIVTPATRNFMRRRGSIAVGSGSTVNDVRGARGERGRKG